jgi:hypothetical protein
LELLQSEHPEENEILFGDDARALSQFLSGLALKFPNELVKRDLGNGQIKWYFYPPTPSLKVDETGKVSPMKSPFRVNPLSGQLIPKGMKVIRINRSRRDWSEENFQ